MTSAPERQAAIMPSVTRARAARCASSWAWMARQGGVPAASSAAVWRAHVRASTNRSAHTLSSSLLNASRCPAHANARTACVCCASTLSASLHEMPLMRCRRKLSSCGEGGASAHMCSSAHSSSLQLPMSTSDASATAAALRLCRYTTEKALHAMRRTSVSSSSRMGMPTCHARSSRSVGTHAPTCTLSTRDCRRDCAAHTRSSSGRSYSLASPTRSSHCTMRPDKSPDGRWSCRHSTAPMSSSAARVTSIPWVCAPGRDSQRHSSSSCPVVTSPQRGSSSTRRRRINSTQGKCCSTATVPIRWFFRKARWDGEQMTEGSASLHSSPSHCECSSRRSPCRATNRTSWQGCASSTCSMGCTPASGMQRCRELMNSMQILASFFNTNTDMTADSDAL
mmetsp:Transcript_35124/g.88380  ORF Transcript_35124/g.88380 Transcript_35124/m.88380 type:complete len:395 (+) Transcript_35124:439-1623(+)